MMETTAASPRAFAAEDHASLIAFDRYLRIVR